MPRTRIADVLAEVFRTYGFDTTSPAHPEAPDGTIHRVDLLAEKEGMDVLVLLHEHETPITPEEITRHAVLRTTLGARYALVATLADITAAAEDAAIKTGALLWDRDAVTRAIGRAVLLEATGASERGEAPTAELLALAATSSPMNHGSGATEWDDAEPTPDGFASFLAANDAETQEPPPTDPHAMPAMEAPMPHDPTTRESGRGWFLETNPPPPERRADPAPAATARPPAPREIETGGEWYLETSRSAERARPTATPRREPAAAYAAPSARMGIPQASGPDPHTFDPQEGILLAPTVTKDRAAHTAKRQVFTIDDTRLRYHPKRVVRWEVEAFVEGRVETTTLSGTLLLDLATRTIATHPRWETPRTLKNGTFDVPVEGKPVRMRPEHAQELISETILEETSREVTLQDHDSSGDYHITVKRRVRISPEDVKVHDEGIHWYPVWGFTGVNGEVEVDGITGEVLAQHLKGPKGTTVLW